MQHCTCVSWACWRWPRRATKVREARQRAVLEHLTSTVGPLCGRAAGRDDYRQLPPSKTQMGGEKKQKKHRRTPTQTQKPCREIPSRHTSTELIIPHSVTLYFGPTMPNMYRRTSPSHTEKPSWVLSDLSLSVAQIACNIFIFSSFTRFLSVCFSVYLKYPGG